MVFNRYIFSASLAIFIGRNFTEYEDCEKIDHDNNDLLLLLPLLLIVTYVITITIIIVTIMVIVTFLESQ